MNETEETKVVLTDKGQELLKFMQLHDTLQVGKDLIDLTGIKGIYPVLNSLKSRGFVEEGEPVVRDFTNNKGETKPKEYKTYQLTDEGRNYKI